MEAERLKYLLSKYQQNQLSEQEKTEVYNYFEEHGWDKLDSIWNDDFRSPPIDIDQEFQNRVHAKLVGDSRVSFRRPRLMSLIMNNNVWARIAAAVLAVISLSYIFFYYQGENQQVLGVAETITPGSKLARMQFEDGTYIEFDDIKKDTLLIDKGIHVKVSDEGNITYEVLTSKPKDNPVYSTVYTPKGGEYTLELSDGSKIWLNSETKVRYPLTFTTRAREVELEGEAYFDVANKTIKGKKVPFIVRTHSQNIEVLGTQFNVNSYEKDIYTTLVEGSIALTASNTSDKLILNPNEQCVYNVGNGSMSRSQVDTYYAVSWRIGKFAFQRSTINKVMKDLARWYDIDVVFNGDFDKITYSGTISRLENFQEVLKLIEMTNQIKFKIDGRRVTVIKT